MSFVRLAGYICSWTLFAYRNFRLVVSAMSAVVPASMLMPGGMTLPSVTHRSAAKPSACPLSVDWPDRNVNAFMYSWSV